VQQKQAGDTVSSHYLAGEVCLDLLTPLGRCGCCVAPYALGAFLQKFRSVAAHSPDLLFSSGVDCKQAGRAWGGTLLLSESLLEFCRAWLPSCLQTLNKTQSILACLR